MGQPTGKASWESVAGKPRGKATDPLIHAKGSMTLLGTHSPGESLWWPQERPVPMRVARGPHGIPLPSMPGPKILCGVGAGTLRFLSRADMDLGVLLESPQGSQSPSRVGACTCAFLPSCSSSVTLPFAWIKGSMAFPGGFHTRLSHEAFPHGCPTCHRDVSRSTA